MKIALATYENIGRFGSFVPDEDAMISDFFTRKGHAIQAEIWDDPNVNWASYDVVLIKSPWDYFVDKIEKFYAWLNHLKSISVKCLNHPDLMKWNADKHYLLDIAWAGLAIVPTLIIEKNESFDLKSCFEKFNCDEIVVKPSISGGAMNTIRLSKTESLNKAEEQIKIWLQEQAYLVQPLKAEITNEGEWSFIYFNSKFSHAILKTAKAEDFRVQHFFGGKIEAKEVQNSTLEQIHPYIHQFCKGSLYARVDGVFGPAGFELMELELIEPYLFLFTHEKSLEHYYEAFLEMTQ